MAFDTKVEHYLHQTLTIEFDNSWRTQFQELNELSRK